MTPSRGAAGETLAAAYLELAGFSIEDRNVRVAGIEIDLLARDGRTLVIVEVKVRSRGDFGGALQAIDHAQRARLVVAGRTLASREAVRIDVIAIDLDPEGITLRHVRNAIGG